MPTGAAAAASNAFLPRRGRSRTNAPEPCAKPSPIIFGRPFYEFQIALAIVKELARRAHLADLVIVGQALSPAMIMSLQDGKLVIHTGCMLLVPFFAGVYLGDMVDFCRRLCLGIMALSDQSVRGALPLLPHADTVTVVTNTPAKGDDLNGTELGRYLSLHDARRYPRDH